MTNRLQDLFEGVSDYVGRSKFFEPRYALLDAAIVVFAVVFTNLR